MFKGSEILAPDLVRERERLALAYESLVISKNIMNGC